VTRHRLGAFAGIATLQFFVVETYAERGWPGYDFVADRISDLGTMRSPHHALVNASLLLQGALIAGGAYLLREQRMHDEELRTGWRYQDCHYKRKGIVIGLVARRDVAPAVMAGDR